MRNLRMLSLALVLALPPSAVLAEGHETEGPTATPDKPMQSAVPAQTYLGVRLMRVPPPLAAQLPDSIARGQGVVIMRIQPDSPAAQAGLRRFDVLTAYDDQRLFTPGQLSALVKSDQAGREVKLQVARAGQLVDMPVTLGERVPMRKKQHWGQPHPNHPYMGRHPSMQDLKQAWYSHCQQR